MTIWPRDVSYTSLYCSLFSSCDVLFGVFVLPLVCHGNWVRSFLITYFFPPSFYPAIEPGLLGNMGWAQKTLMCLPKCHFLSLWRNGEKKKAERRAISLPHSATSIKLGKWIFPKQFELLQKQHCEKGCWKRPTETTCPALYLCNYSWDGHKSSRV